MLIGACAADSREHSRKKVLADWFVVGLEGMPWFAPSYNVAPQSFQPVVRLDSDSGKRAMNPFWSKRRLPDTYFSFGEQRTLDERIVSRS